MYKYNIINNTYKSTRRRYSLKVWLSKIEIASRNQVSTVVVGIVVADFVA